MVTPAKGDYQARADDAEARQDRRRVGPGADEAAGNQCKSYGAPAIMRVPGRVHITWQDDKTLRLDTDAGTQTRMFRLDKPAAKGEPSWQGDSVAEWDMQPAGRGAAAERAAGEGSLKVVTTNMRAGYLRKNGVPYSEDAKLTEYFDVIRAPQRRQCS